MISVSTLYARKRKLSSFIENILAKGLLIYIPQQVDISKITAMTCLLTSLLSEPGDRLPDKQAVKTFYVHCFIFCYVWCVGGNVVEGSRRGLEEVVKRQFEEFEEAEL